MPLDPAGSGLFGAGLVDILTKGDKLVEEKRSRALHDAAVRTVKTGKRLVNTDLSRPPQGVGPKRASIRRSHVLGRVASLQSITLILPRVVEGQTRSPRGASQPSFLCTVLPICDPCEHSCHASVGG